MNLAKMDLFQMATRKMGWLTERQVVLSQNIANADTPNYRSKDLQEVDFSRMLDKTRQVNVTLTRSGHIPGANERNDLRRITEGPRDVYEVNPNDNQVVMEEQLIKLSDTAMQYRLVTNIYNKNLSMMKMAVGNPRG